MNTPPTSTLSTSGIGGQGTRPTAKECVDFTIAQMASAAVVNALVAGFTAQDSDQNTIKILHFIAMTSSLLSLGINVLLTAEITSKFEKTGRYFENGWRLGFAVASYGFLAVGVVIWWIATMLKYVYFSNFKLINLLIFSKKILCYQLDIIILNIKVVKYVHILNVIYC